MHAVTPTLSVEEAIELLTKYYGWTVLPDKVQTLPSYEDQNFRVHPEGHSNEYVFKITRSDAKHGSVVFMFGIMWEYAGNIKCFRCSGNAKQSDALYPRSYRRCMPARCVYSGRLHDIYSYEYAYFACPSSSLMVDLRWTISTSVLHSYSDNVILYYREWYLVL